MNIWDEIRHRFMVKHEHASELIFDEQSHEPVAAIYWSGFETEAMRDAQLKRFFLLVQASQARAGIDNEL